MADIRYRGGRASRGRRRSTGRSRVYKPEWHDPFPGILGTKPEKMVLAELYRREVPFYFQYPLGDVKLTPGVTENYRLDFYIPSTRIAIEVNGDYWHTLGDAPMKDAYRYALLNAIGIKVVVWWESEILVNLRGLFESEPLLNHPPVTGPPIHMENDHDDLRAVRAVNARRRGSLSTTRYRRSRRQRRRHTR